MEPCFPSDFFSEFFMGDFFSVYVGCPGSYWVVSNDFPSVFKGPYDKGTALKIAISSNEHFNILKSKGLY